jgi:two-component system chemotaxis response regulator CheB
VKEADDGDEVGPGRVLICPGGCHMTVKKTRTRTLVVIDESAPQDKYVPSVDRLFSSAADALGDRCMGVVLTGMGNDGTKGMKDMKAKGCPTVAESKETAVVFGMPAEAIKAGAAQRVLPVQAIPAELIRAVMGERRA